MFTEIKRTRIPIVLIALSFALLAAGLISTTTAQAHGSGPYLPPPESSVDASSLANTPSEALVGKDPIDRVADIVLSPTAACAGGPVIDGITLDECYDETFSVGGTNKTVRVWYTKNAVTATRMVDGSPVVLSHWINTDAEAQQVAAWGRQAWERYYAIFGRHPYDIGCSNRINVQMEDGVGWAGIAYWASSGSCRIGIDSPMVRGGGGQWATYHEFAHYMQYSFNAGCYAYLQANYPDDAEFVEGYADLGADAVNSTSDSAGYAGTVGGYDPTTSMYDKSYGNVFNKYFIEQVGSLYTSTDAWHHMDANKDHYLECDVQDTLYVLDDLIPTLKPGMSEEELFLNFFAANWAKDWADPVTQPELVYTDDDSNPYGSIALQQNVTLSSGSQSWNGQSIVDWAGKYYQVRPQDSCEYVTVNVDGAAGAKLGINLMAADTAGSTSVSRSAWIGENFVRTFAGAGVHDKIVAAVNAFDSGQTFDVSFTCVTPVLDILEPKQTNFALVGDPASPIAFLARFKVSSSGTPVRGLPESSFTADAEGDAITIVPGTFQEVGEEYWAVLLPPVKPAGTSFVDLRICLDSSICDTETDALLYVNPGNTDFALVFDASGSMNTEDVIGEGKRVDNAKKAGGVLADLLRVGDRVLVTDFSAINNPVGCGLPSGSGNCPLDIQTKMARTDVTGAATIATAKSAITTISAREWTPIGAALQDAKNKLQAAPYSLNPKHIVLLSDGEENVNPLYASVRTELIDSGVVINTIGFSGEAPAALLAQIAADTGGSYRFVPTTGGTLRARASTEQVNQILNLGVPPSLVEQVTAPLLPGPLGLADVYDYYETKGQGATRVFHNNYTSTPDSTWKEFSQYVDESVNTLRLVVAGKQEDNDVPGFCEGYHRKVEILQPGADPGKGWIPVSPPETRTPPPANWDIRNSVYDDVVIITNPLTGTWKLRTGYHYQLCKDGQVNKEATAQAITESPTAFETDFMMNGSVESNITLQGRFLLPIVNNQGMAGDVVPIVATLLNRTGTIKGAIVLAAVEKPGAQHLLLLRDDGLHSDGAADDGIYGVHYGSTDVGGTYNVRIVAYLLDESAGQYISREWLGSFWIKGPELDDNDQDQDGLPDDWERRCKLSTQLNNANADSDRDGLTDGQELYYGTIPCDPDTDNGGERDGSEINGGRNPLYPKDDLVRPLGHINIRILNQMVRINWTRPLSYTSMMLYISTSPDQLGDAEDIGTGGTFTRTGLINDQTYYLTLAGVNGAAEGDYSEPIEVTPKADPDAPSGAILINGDAQVALSRDAVLSISTTDTPLPGMAQSANAHLGGILAITYNEVSGNVQMRISNDPSFAGASWEPFVQEKAWTLASASSSPVYRVYAQFKDAAGNESLIVYDDIFVANQLYLPIVLKQ